MASCAFVIPGDINLPTGGYAYDRRVMALLPSHGLDVRHVTLPGTFPAPSQSDLAATEATLAALPTDTVLLFDGLAYGAIPAAVLGRIRQPIVALCHHPLAYETGTPPVRAAEFKALETAALAKARRIVVSSAATRATLARDFGVPAGKVTVSEPGTDRAPSSLPWKGGPIRMLAVGSVIPRKGYDVLVEALSGLRRATDGTDWHVRIAGSLTLDRETAEIVRLKIIASKLSDRVRLLGAVDTPTLQRLYADTHLFLMPSLYEGYGMALGEAMVRGLPIISTTGGAAADLVPEGAGLKVRPGDAEAFRFALQRLIVQPALLSDMAMASLAAGRALPTWDDTARIIASVVKEVAS